MIHEPAVALTDALVAVESAAFGWRLARDRRARGPLHAPFVVFFGATAVASGAGAALHGLTSDRADPRRRALWRVSLTSIGVAALSSWTIAARLRRPGRSAGVEGIAAAAHVPYFVVVATGDRPFWMAIASYVPGAIALGAVLAGRLGDPQDRGTAALGLAGLAVTFAAAGVQVRRIGFGRTIDHNAVYHALQAIGIALFDRAAVGFVTRTGPARG